MTNTFIRGGSWNGVPGNVRSANRIWLTPGTRSNFIGFRLLEELPQEGCVVRGGSWYCLPWYLRSASRGWNHTGDRDFNLGFRLLQEK